MLDHLMYNEEIEPSTLMTLAVNAVVGEGLPELAHKILDAWYTLTGSEDRLESDEAGKIWAKTYAKIMRCSLEEAFEVCDYDYFEGSCPSEFVKILARVEAGRTKAMYRYVQTQREVR